MKPALTTEILRNYTESIISTQVPASPGKYLRRRVTSLGAGIVLDIEPLDAYYVQLINDTLKQIRHGKTAYLFRLAQVRDVLRFEPSAQFAVIDGIISVNLNRS